MNEKIEKLLELQNLDLRIKRFKRRLYKIPVEKDDADKELSSIQSKIDRTNEEIKKIHIKIKEIEGRIDAFKERIKDLKSKSVMVKKNDEYRALLTEIEDCNYKIGQLEENQLTIMDELEERKVELRNYEKLYKNMELDVDETKEELEDLSKDIEEEIKSLLEKRKEAVDKVDKKLLSIYKRLIRRDGTPLSPIIHGTCGNCHLKLTPQTFNNAKKGLIITCDFCGYLLYYPKEEK